jgi:hypothetical protein
MDLLKMRDQAVRWNPVKDMKVKVEGEIVPRMMF